MKRLFLAAACLAALTSHAAAQQVNLDAPFNSVGHSYYEQIGVRWGLAGRGWFFNFGGPGPGAGVAPPFGGFDPNAGANFGFGFGGNGFNGSFNLSAGQGSSTTFGSASPSVTVMNGQTGFFADTQQRPFVTGLVPVVGSPIMIPPVLPPFAPPQSVLQERIGRLQAGEGLTAAEAGASSAGESGGSAAAPPSPLAGEGPGVRGSSAERGDLSVASIKAAKAAAKSAKEAALAEEIAVLLEKAQGKIEAGQPSVAKAYLQMAARKATGDQRAEIQRRIAELEAR
jgi:hypothetical protein